MAPMLPGVLCHCTNDAPTRLLEGKSDEGCGITRHLVTFAHCRFLAMGLLSPSTAFFIG